MISVVIPTIYKSNLFEDFIEQFVAWKKETKRKDELILIDNAYKKDYEGVVQLKPKENLKVNPSWNLGVETAKGDLIVLLNDDILVQWKTLAPALEELFKDSNLGVVGLWCPLLLDKDLGWQNPSSKEERKKILQWSGNHFLVPMKEVYDAKKGHFMYPWFGTLMAFRKKDFVLIPPELEIYFGDSFICDQMLLKGLEVKGISVYPLGSMHTSTGALSDKVLKGEAIRYYSMRRKYEKSIEHRRI